MAADEQQRTRATDKDWDRQISDCPEAPEKAELLWSVLN